MTLSKCKAVVNISQNEDFGMGAVEGMVYGKPTYCINEGGYLETTINDFNSFHVDRYDIQNDLLNKISTTSDQNIISLKENCLSTAKKYSIKKFQEKISSFMII